MSAPAAKAADAAVAVSWLSFFFSHIDDINKVAQFIALIVAITASVVAITYHIKKLRE